jgi:hypothetical protein
MAFPYDFVANDLRERFDEQRLIEITDVTNNPPTTRNDAAIEKAAIDAAGELEKHAGRYYVTPLTPFPAFLRPDFLDLWAWRLLFNCKPDWLQAEARGEGFSWSDRRRELLTWMQGLSSPDRKSVLAGCTELSERTSASGVWATSGTPKMTREKLERCP